MFNITMVVIYYCLHFVLRTSVFEQECYSFTSLVLDSVILRIVHRVRCFCSVRPKITREKGDFFGNKQKMTLLVSRSYENEPTLSPGMFFEDMVCHLPVVPDVLNTRYPEKGPHYRDSPAYDTTQHFASSLGHYHFSNDALQPQTQ